MAKRKFTKIWESAINRYTLGGFLNGDLVKIKPNYKSHAAIKDNHSIITGLKGLIDSGCNLRITNVKNKYPAVMAGDNTDFKGCNVEIDIAPEQSPGRYGPSHTVPSEILEIINTEPNLSPIPNKFKYDNKIKIKPEAAPVKSENEEVPFYGNKQATTAYVADKVTKTEHNLKNTDVKIPSVGPKNHKDPAENLPNYTSIYMRSM